MLEQINILVVEDNLLNQKIVNFILLKHGALVQTALNGKEAINLMNGNIFDVILMDIQMPEMDGFATTVHIREQMKNNVPIIALTASIFEEQSRECFNMGMNACISKPIEEHDLCELILNLTKDRKN